jgi:hypothetical protein
MTAVRARARRAWNVHNPRRSLLLCRPVPMGEFTMRSIPNRALRLVACGVLAGCQALSFESPAPPSEAPGGFGGNGSTGPEDASSATTAGGDPPTSGKDPVSTAQELGEDPTGGGTTGEAQECQPQPTATFRTRLPGRASMARAQYAVSVGAGNTPSQFLQREPFELLFAEATNAQRASLRLHGRSPSDVLDLDALRLARLQIRVETDPALRPATHLVMLVDVGVRMQPLASLTAAALRSAYGALRGDDRLTVVRFARSADIVVDAVPGADPEGLDELEQFLDDLETGRAMEPGHDFPNALSLAKPLLEPAESPRASLLLLTDANLIASRDGVEDDALEVVRALREELGSSWAGLHVAQLARAPLGGGNPELQAERLDAFAEAGTGITLYFDDEATTEDFFEKRALALLHANDSVATATPTEISVYAESTAFLGVGYSSPSALDSSGFELPEPTAQGLLRVVDVPVVLSCPWLQPSVNPTKPTEFTLQVESKDPSAVFEIEPLLDSALLIDSSDRISVRFAALDASFQAARAVASGTDPTGTNQLLTRARDALDLLEKTAGCSSDAATDDCVTASKLERFLGLDAMP